MKQPKKTLNKSCVACGTQFSVQYPLHMVVVCSDACGEIRKRDLRVANRNRYFKKDPERYRSYQRSYKRQRSLLRKKEAAEQ